MSVIGKRSSRAMAMYMRGISGKWKHMWHSSPSGSGPVRPKYCCASSGHILASASSMRPRKCWSRCARMLRMTAWVSGRFSLLVPSRSTRYGTASSLSPSMPMSSQKRITDSTSLSTCGLSKFRSGWCE
ncbi:hypothetical protein D3C81_1911540 [compost metagenome]